MKRLLVITLIFSGLINLSAQDDVLLNFKSLAKKYAKSEENVLHEKKGIDSKTWFDRGKLLQDIYQIDLEYISEGSSTTEINIHYKDPLSVVKDEENPNTEILKYERIEYVMVNGVLSKWNRIKSVTDSPLDKALVSYVKTLEFDEKNKYNEKVKAQLAELKINYKQSGINYYYSDDYKHALHSFEKVLAINRMKLFDGELDTVMIQYSGIIARELKDYEKSAEYYMQLAEMNYGGPNIFLNIKNDYLALQDSAGAIAGMEIGFDKFPDTLNIVANLVDLYIKTKNIDKGLVKINEAIAKYPEKGDLNYWKGRLLLNTEDEDRIDQALVAYEKAIELNQDLYYVYYDIGFIYFLQGQDIFSQAGMEKDVEYRKEINDIATEKYDSAIPMMENALRLNTDNAEIKKETLDVLKRIYYKLYGAEDDRYIDVIEKLKEF
ncbi:MAG: tetratricopeptide repeat protein [Bacteroidales bacterium]|nr:tetratricopeptide repeat protein [Bacteroidales bacterium]